MATSTPESRPEARGNALFVYGSLAPGKVNAHLLEPLVGTWSEARVAGSLHHVGWAAELGFLGIKLGPRSIDRLDVAEGHDDVVSGFIFESDQLADVWPELDRFEGRDYHPVQTTAHLVSGDYCKCIVYTAAGI